MLKNELNTGFKSLPSWAKGVIAVAALGGVIYLVFKISKKFNKDAHDIEKKQIDNELNDLKNTEKQTYPNSQYNSFANQLEQAMEDFGTDEQAILKVFYQLKNDTDYLLLKKSFGVRPYMGGLFPPVITGQNYDMVEHLRQELSDYWIDKINSILKSKKIKYRV